MSNGETHQWYPDIITAAEYESFYRSLAAAMAEIGLGRPLSEAEVDALIAAPNYSDSYSWEFPSSYPNYVAKWNNSHSEDQVRAAFLILAESER